jgi:PTH1 family peptidyl-tRNA hydrolase
MRVIVGLGNPDEQYKMTRHNTGFMAVDKIGSHESLIWHFNKKLKSEIAKSGNTVFIKPLTFMNNSGEAVQAVLSYYKLLPKKLGVFSAKGSDLSEVLTVIHDDLDIELGKYKIATDSRSAGHNGVQSVIDNLKTKNFKRVRIGIKTEAMGKIPAEKFVLQKFKDEEMKIINEVVDKVIKEL